MSLVLSRRVGESLLIGDSIVVRIVEIHGQQCKIAIDAPKDVLILREELAPHDSEAGKDCVENDGR